mgnify:FL=1
MKKQNPSFRFSSRSLPTSGYALQKKDLPRAAEVMARAFFHDPSIRFLCGGQTTGPHDREYFRAVLKSLSGEALILATDEAVGDLLVLLPPGSRDISPLRFFQNGGLKLLGLFGPGLFLRSLRYENNCQKIQDRVAPREAWTCLCFVVAPERQGRGEGSRLMKPLLRALDERGIPLYLETHRERNLEIYRHYGFEEADVSRIPKTNIRQYALLRKAREPLE